MKMTMIQISKTLKMQKYFIIVAVTMLSLVSCTKFEDTAPPRKITFETATYRPQTKAGETYKSVTTEFTSFNCMAFLHAENGSEAFYDTQNMFGTGGEIIYPYKENNTVWRATDNTEAESLISYWAPSHDYFWPKGKRSYINFVAWKDIKGTLPNTKTETSLVWNNYEVLSTDNLLYADEAWRYKQNTTNDPQYQGDGITLGVPMIFHHALAQLCIKVIADPVTQNNQTGVGGGKTQWDVTLSNVKLEGVYNHGNLELANSAPSGTDAKTNPWTGSWTATGNKTTINLNAVTTPLQYNTAVDLLSMQSVLPQAITDDMVLSFDFHISTKFGTTQTLTDEDEYAHENIHTSIKLSDFSGTVGNSWQMNKKITYTITINPKTELVRIDPAMEEWITTSGTYPNNN